MCTRLSLSLSLAHKYTEARAYRSSFIFRTRQRTVIDDVDVMNSSDYEQYFEIVWENVRAVGYARHALASDIDVTFAATTRQHND
jgi:hypothetical protein